MPLTSDVYVASRRNVVRIAGSPFTFSTTRHWPSPAIGAPASDFSVAGMSGTKAGLAGVFALPVGAWPVGAWPVGAWLEVIPSPLGTASENAGLPPLGGGL